MAQFGNRPYTADEAAAAFWAKVDKRGPTECWPWTGAVTTHGYGSVKFQQRYRGAHRLAYILTNGQPQEGLQVCHRCDNRLCCNPAHYFLGTKKDNAVYSMNKGRNVFGERNVHAILTEAKVREIRARWRSNGKRACAAVNNASELAKEYGVRREAILAVAARRTWKHLP